MLFSMNTEQIISEIDLEISKLQQAKALLIGATSVSSKGRGRPKKSGTVVAPATKKSSRKPLSVEAKARIATAQKKRWAAAKKTAAK
jgi:hypothetical protein